jgi:hypothetical protein
MSGKKVNLQKYDAKRHNPGRSHVCLEQRKVNPTLQDPGNVQKFIYLDQGEHQRRAEE